MTDSHADMPFKPPECRNLLQDLSEESMTDVNVTTEGDKDDDGPSKEMEHIKVYLRMKPVTAEEHAQGMDDGCIAVESDRTVIVSAPRISHAFRTSTYGLSRQRQRFTFTHVFPSDTSQKQFFDGTVHSMVSEFVSGQNCLIFTYGVTNSGKTYTIQGDTKGNVGILPRSLDVIFSRISGSQCTDMSLKPVMFGDVAQLNASQIKQETKLKEIILSDKNTTVARDSGGEQQPSSNAIEKNSGDMSTAEPIDADETANAHVSQALSDDSLESGPALIPSSATALPQSEQSKIRFMLWASFAEIYNEQIFDLLESSVESAARLTRASSLQLRDDRDGRPYIRGLREVQVSDADEAWRLIQVGRDNQHISSTRLNRTSSRSHSIFTLRLVQFVDADQPVIARVASLSFCDLAGSERYLATGGFNERIKEAGNINSSLLTLGRCIDALRRNQARREHLSAPRLSVVPFRESKLTRLFQNFLCGQGRVVMIINVSQCANVFDETLHAVRYSALARQIVTDTSNCSFFSLPGTLAAAENHKVSLHGKHEPAVAASKPVVEKKRKFGTIDEENAGGDSKQLTASEENLPEEDSYYSDANEHDETWKDEREKFVVVIKKLHKALTEQRQEKATHETQIRAEVCDEMQKQMVRIQSEHEEAKRRHAEILEEKYERKMEIYMEAVQKSCKRQRRDRPVEDDDDEYVPSVDLHAAQVQLSRLAEENRDLKNENVELQQQLSVVRENVGKVSSERDSMAAKLTKLEFLASETQKQFEVLYEEKKKVLADHSRLQKTVEDLSSKLTEVEHRHEVSCRQLRREKALLEQKLTTAGQLAIEIQSQPSIEAIDSKKDETLEDTLKDQVKELEEALKNEQSNAQSLEQRLEAATDDATAVDRTWSEHCKEVEARFQGKCFELSKLQEKHDALGRKLQDAVKSSEEAKEKCVEAENVTKELADKETQLQQLTSTSKSLKEEINQLKAESETVCKNFMTELSAKETECAKLQTEIKGLKQDASATESSQDKLNAVKSELQDKLKEMEDEKKETLNSLDCELKKTNTQLTEAKNLLAGKTLQVERMEKKLEKEKDRCHQLENAATDSKKQLCDLQLQLSEERKKGTDLYSSTQALEAELNEAKNARLDAENKLTGQVEATAASEAKVVAIQKELDVVNTLSQRRGEHETTLQQQVSSSSQVVNELQAKLKSIQSEVANKDEKYQACCSQIIDLKEKTVVEHEKFELALEDARSNEATIEQMRLTLKEQDMTMQTQDKALLERDAEVEDLKQQLARAKADREKLETLTDQVRQKNSRIRELEKEVSKVEKSRNCLEKDVCDTTAELRTSERNLADAKKELASAKQELESLKSEEDSAKSIAKQLCQRELELSNLRKQLESAQHQNEKLVRDLAKANDKCKADKEKELAAWREERDKLVARLEMEIRELKTGRSEVDAMQQKIEQLSRTVDAKDQAIVDLREQHLQLQQQLNLTGAGDHARKHVTRRSKIPTASRVPLRATDENADVSMGVLAAGGSAVDLDETVSSKRRATRRHHADSSQLARTSEVVAEQSPRSTRTRRKQTTGVADVIESYVSEAAEEAPQTRRLRSRRF